MVKQAVALKTGTASAEAILRRFHSYNVTHPTSKAWAALGTVVKTIALGAYLSSIDLRYEVQAGLHVGERWNEANNFLCYGRQGLWATNSRAQQEVTTRALQLLQTCLRLINTVLLEHTIAQHHLLDQLRAEDRRGLTPLFYGDGKPCGLCTLKLDQPSCLEAA
jgi:TnpA family transposase